MFYKQKEEFMTTIDRPPLNNLVVTALQIVLATDPVTDGYLTRPDVEPLIEMNQEGVYTITLRNQGKYGEFDLPYIQSQVIYQCNNLVAVLVAYHDTEAYGRKSDRRVSKGQFWRFYLEIEEGIWSRVNWQQLNNVNQASIHSAWVAWRVCESEWMKEPGKLRGDRTPASKVTFTTYKVVEVRDGRYYSLFKPDEEYILGQEKKQAAKPKHQGGYFSYPDIERAEKLARSQGWMRKQTFALLECEIRGRIIHYGERKWASTYLLPIRELARYP
jgi:hypothetical protein